MLDQADISPDISRVISTHSTWSMCTMTVENKPLRVATLPVERRASTVTEYRQAAKDTAQSSNPLSNHVPERMRGTM